MDTKFQKKHESDMTNKEKRELEREKLASMDGKEKLEYIWAYYKLQIALAAGAILLAIGIGVWIDGFQDENMLYAAIINGTEVDMALMEEFQAQQEDEERHHKYILDTSIVVSGQGDSSELEYASRMKLATLVGGGTVDIYICPEGLYQEYSGEEGVLLSMAELLDGEFLERHGDICEKDAIRVENSAVLEKYGYQNNGPAYLIVFYYAAHREVAADFIKFLVE